MRRLHRAAAALDAALLESGTCGHILRMRMAQSATDVIAFVPIFRQAHTAAVEVHRQEAQNVYEIISVIGGGKVGDLDVDDLARSARELQVSYKALYFLIRAFQDRLYTVAARLLAPGDAAGQSMGAAFKRPQNPVRRFLDERVPAYVEWFPAWRDQRNRVKDGVSFSIAGPQEDLGIRFDEFKAHGGLSVDLAHAVRLGNIVAALDNSASLVEALVEPASADARRAHVGGSHD